MAEKSVNRYVTGEQMRADGRIRKGECEATGEIAEQEEEKCILTLEIKTKYATHRLAERQGLRRLLYRRGGRTAGDYPGCRRKR